MNFQRVQLDEQAVVTTPIHLLVRSEEGYFIACVPNLTQFSAGDHSPLPHLRTDDYRAVTCANCLQTGEYLKQQIAHRQAVLPGKPR